MDIDRAVAYVQVQGNAIERARLASSLWHEPASQAVLDELASMQRPDGGFAYWVPEVSNICDTAYVLQWFDDLGIYRNAIADSACRFLLVRQQEDGGWDEAEAVLLFEPLGWMAPGRIDTRVWLTAFCAHVLIRFGYAGAEGSRCPADFLLAHRQETGRLAGYLRATWIALPMLALHPGPESEPFQEALAVVGRDYSPAWTGAYLAWFLRCLYDAGLTAGHPLVARALADLQQAQRPDGSWEPESGEGEVHAVNATIAALRELRRNGCV